MSASEKTLGQAAGESSRLCCFSLPEPFDFGNCFQRVQLARKVVSGLLGRQFGQFEKPVHDINLGKTPSDLGTEASMIAFCFSLIAWRTAGIAISLGAERSGFL